MRIVRVIILVLLVAAFMPLEAFCNDHHDAEEHHHGVVMCNASCHGVVLINAQSVDLPETVTPFYAAQDFSYDEPILPTEFRPPISVS